MLIPTTTSLCSRRRTAPDLPRAWADELRELTWKAVVLDARQINQSREWALWAWLSSLGTGGDVDLRARGAGLLPA